MDILNTKSGYALTRNPIVVKEAYSGADFDAAGGTLRVSLAGSTIYKGRFFPPLELDISEIVDAAADYFPEAELSGVPFIRVLDSMSLADRWQFYISAEYDRIEYESALIAVPGGIPTRNYMEYPDSDIFSRRFFSRGNNFFLTSRTAGHTITIKETELAPLYFLNKTACRIEVFDAVSGCSLVENVSPGLWALDVDALRKWFFDEYGVLVQVFSISRDYIPATTIVIEKSCPAPERYRVKFRNSLGVFEVVELVGKLTFSDIDNDSDSEEFQRYNPASCSFSYRRERITSRQAATITTPVDDTSSMLFLLDMAQSDEAYLLGVTVNPVRVIPVVEPQYNARPEEPKDITVTLNFANDDAPILPAIGADSVGTNRIFSNQFSKQFN